MQGFMGEIVVLIALAAARAHNEETAPATEPVQAAEARPAPAPEEQPDDDSRLLLSPTGRPLRRGVGYFSDHYLFFPGVSYGVTENLSISGGVSVVPETGSDGQLYFLSPKLGKRFSERFSASAGLLYVHVPWGDAEPNFALGYAVGTYGGPGGSVSAGVGVWRRMFEHPRLGPALYYERAAPILMVGGEKRLSPHAALVFEKWLGPYGLPVSGPLGLAVRLSARTLSADLGIVATPQPFPWVSVSYHFGRPRR